MSHLKILISLLPLALALHGCSADTTNADCGEGTARKVDGQTYCLYQSNLIIEGFECPNQMTPHNVPNGMVCSPDGQLPDDLIDPFDPMDPWCVANCDVITDPIPNVRPTPTNAGDFQRIYRQRDYACVVDSSDKATCWGPAFEGRLKSMERTYTKVGQMTLSEDFLCVLGTDQSIQCHGNGPTDTFDANQTYTALTSAQDSVCALGGTNAPYDQLNCLSTSPGVSFTQLAKDNQWIGKSFNQFTLKVGADDGRVGSGCGLDTSGGIQWLRTFDEVQIPGPYKEAYCNTIFFTCALTPQDDVECWSVDDAPVQIAAPAGKFVELYGPTCGLLDTNKVVCWDDLEVNTPQDQTLTLTTLFDEHPRAFDLHYSIGGRVTGWCAIKLNGDIECSDF